MLRWNLAGLALLAGAAFVQADDVVRLGGSFLADDDTHLVYRRGHGFHGHHGYRGHGWGHFGHRGHYGHYGHYGHRHFGYRSHYGYGWGGYHRPYYSSFYHRPYYSYSRPYFYSSYAYYPYRSYAYYSSPAYYFIDPCAAEVPAMPEATTLGSSAFEPRPDELRPERAGPVMPPVDEGNGTYRYDGGPRQRVPMPDAGPASKPVSPALPRDFKLVSQPANPKYTFAAYGETPRHEAATPSTRLVSEAPLPPARFTYAAYGGK